MNTYILTRIPIWWSNFFFLRLVVYGNKYSHSNRHYQMCKSIRIRNLFVCMRMYLFFIKSLFVIEKQRKKNSKILRRPTGKFLLRQRAVNVVVKLLCEWIKTNSVREVKQRCYCRNNFSLFLFVESLIVFLTPQKFT